MCWSSYIYIYIYIYIHIYIYIYIYNITHHDMRVCVFKPRTALFAVSRFSQVSELCTLWGLAIAANHQRCVLVQYLPVAELARSPHVWLRFKVAHPVSETSLGLAASFIAPWPYVRSPSAQK